MVEVKYMPQEYSLDEVNHDQREKKKKHNLLPRTPIRQMQIVNQRNDERGIHAANPPSYRISFHVNSNNFSSEGAGEEFIR